MFTGIVETLGLVRAVGKSIIEIDAPEISKDLKIGGSLAVNGVCLTVVKKNGARVSFNLAVETRKRSTLGLLKKGVRVNLERPLKNNSRIEGHFVLGHVDGMGQIVKIFEKPKEKSFCIGFPKRLRHTLVEKGSVTVDGASLTIGKVSGGSFWIHCISHTLQHTNFQFYRQHTRVNLEADILAKLTRR